MFKHVADVETCCLADNFKLGISISVHADYFIIFLKSFIEFLCIVCTIIYFIYKPLSFYTNCFPLDIIIYTVLTRINNGKASFGEQGIF